MENIWKDTHEHFYSGAGTKPLVTHIEQSGLDLTFFLVVYFCRSSLIPLSSGGEAFDKWIFKAVCPLFASQASAS